jgi:hypothetical protein
VGNKVGYRKLLSHTVRDVLVFGVVAGLSVHLMLGVGLVSMHDLVAYTSVASVFRFRNVGRGWVDHAVHAVNFVVRSKSGARQQEGGGGQSKGETGHGCISFNFLV